MARKKKKLFGTIHLEIALALVAYFVVSFFILIKYSIERNLLVSFAIPMVFGGLSTTGFLYLFSHKDVFPFMNKVEAEEKKKEKQYLAKYVRFGKILASVIISFVGGPVFLALTARFLFGRTKNKYWIALAITLLTTVVLVAMSKGLFSFVL